MREEAILAADGQHSTFNKRTLHVVILEDYVFAESLHGEVGFGFAEFCQQNLWKISTCFQETVSQK